MYTEFKKPFYICIMLLIFSVVCTIISYMVRFNPMPSYTDYAYMSVRICAWLTTFVTLLLVIIIWLIKKLMEILKAMDSSVSERIAEMKKEPK